MISIRIYRFKYRILIQLTIIITIILITLNQQSQYHNLKPLITSQDEFVLKPFDIKLTHIYNEIRKHTNTLPFNWNLLTNAHDKLNITQSLDCQLLKSLIPVKPDRDIGCIDQDGAYPVKVTQNALTYFKDINTRVNYGYLHQLTLFPVPDKLIFLNNDLVITDTVYTDKNMNELLSQYGLSDLQEKTSQYPKNRPLPLQRSLFEWNITLEIEKLTLMKPHLINALDPTFKEVKHFGEAYLVTHKLQSGHFDWRFFQGLTQETPLHQHTIHRMIRAWFKMCLKLGIVSWLNHGSMIGYYWNGINLPFDNDIDVSMPIQSLYELTNYNNSVVFDEVGGSYFIDINPLFGDRTKLKNKNNVIDARFIDVSTGLYIDITLLSLVNDVDKFLSKFDKFDKSKLMQLLNYNDFYNGFKPLDDIKATTRKQLRQNIRDKSGKLFKNLLNDLDTSIFHDIVHCRNYHFYNLQELTPLLPGYFENTPVHTPNNWLKNLNIEYDPLVFTMDRYKQYKYLPNMNLWLSEKQCSLKGTDDEIKLNCLLNEEVRVEYERVGPYLELQNKLWKSMSCNSIWDVGDVEGSFGIRYYKESVVDELCELFDNQPLR